MIDEKNLIEDLKAKIYPEKFGERCNAKDVISGVLQVISEQPKTDWIPCEERLPDDFMSMKYLTIRKGHTLATITYYCVVNHKWYLSRNSSKEIDVIAWQPIQPYKKEGGLDE